MADTADRVQETATTTGTGNFTLAGAATGFRTFNAALGTSVQLYYCIDGGATGEWEVGEGHLSASTTLVRDTVLASSNANALVSFSAGSKTVFATAPARQLRSPQSIAVAAGATTPTPPTGERPIIWSTVEAAFLSWNGTYWERLTASSPPQVGVDWYLPLRVACAVANSGFTTLDFSGPAFAGISAPTAGQTVFIDATDPFTYFENLSPIPRSSTGIYVLGSVATLSAVPFSRHPEWPAARVLYPGQHFICQRAPNPLVLPTSDIGPVDVTVGTSNISASANTIGLGYSQFPATGTLLYVLKATGATLPVPLAERTPYYARDAVSETSTKLSTTVGGGVLDFTTGGTDNGSVQCLAMFQVPLYTGTEQAVVTLLGAQGASAVGPGGSYSWSTLIPDNGQAGHAVSLRYGYPNQGTVNSVDYTGMPVVAGAGAQAGVSSTALGYAARVDDNGVVVGNSVVAGSGAVAIGAGMSARGTMAVAIGRYASAAGNAGTALGSGATATGERSTAVGYGATGGAADSVGLGVGALALGSSSIVLGHGRADNDGQVSVHGGYDSATSGYVGHTSFYLDKQTTNATQTAMTLYSDGVGTPSSLVALYDCELYDFDGTIQAHSATDSASWRVRGRFASKHLGGPFVDVEVLRSSFTSGSSAWSVAFSGSQSAGISYMSVLVTGAASTTIKWLAALHGVFNATEGFTDIAFTAATLLPEPTSSRAIAAGATTPAMPVGERPIIWSTVENDYLGWNGTWWGTQSKARIVECDWFISDAMADYVITGSTINFKSPGMGGNTTGTTLSPAAGDVIFILRYAATGVYVLGSVADLSAVPFTRHPDWPVGGVVPAGTQFVCKRSSAPLMNGASSSPFAAETNVGADTITSGITLQDPRISMGFPVCGYVIKSGSPAVLPGGLTDNTAYAVSVVLDNSGSATFSFSTDRADLVGTKVNLTSAGTDFSGVAGWGAVLFFTPVFLPSTTVVHSGPDDTTWSTTGSTLGISYETTVSDQLGQAPYGFAGGPNAVANFFGTAIGSSAFSSAGVAIGYAAVETQSGIAIGSSASTYGAQATGIGYSSLSMAMSSVALGSNSVAIGPSGLALGSYALAHRSGEVAIQRLAPGWIGSPSNNSFAEQGWVKAFINGYAASAAEFALATTWDAPATGFEFSSGGGSAFKFRGFVTAAGPYGALAFSATWLVEGHIVSVSGVPTVAYTQKLVFSSGSVGDLKFRLSVSLGTYPVPNSLNVLAKGVADTLWTAEIEAFKQDWYAYSGEIGFPTAPIRTDNVIEVVASEALVAGNLVSLWNSSGAKVRKAEANPAQPADGFVLANYASSDTALVYISGENPMLSSLTVGPLFLSATAGGVTSTAPGTGNLVQPVGMALSATKMLFQRGTPIQT